MADISNGKPLDPSSPESLRALLEGIRAAIGMGMHDAVRCVQLAVDEDMDIVAACWAVYARGFAVNVQPKDHRPEWERSYGLSRAQRERRSEILELRDAFAVAFPGQNSTPPPRA